VPRQELPGQLQTQHSVHTGTKNINNIFKFSSFITYVLSATASDQLQSQQTTVTIIQTQEQNKQPKEKKNT
jgi:hypothetical protein